MPIIKKRDFVEVEYTGKTKEDNIIFDTTDEKTAKENNFHSQGMEYGPVAVCVGEGQILKGLDEEVEGKEIGKEYTIELSPEKAFGKKDVKLIKMIPISAFKKQNIEPQPGLQVNIDGVLGLIRRVGGGRCLVDFNHPLSGKEVVYTLKINKIVTDDKEKIKSYLKLALHLKAEVEIKENTAEIKIKKEIPKEIQENISKKLVELVTSIKKINFVKDEKKENK
ncbi:peptidylprolyl isomerase [Candidatus Woesearchaeota archaeon]|nr:peptidylprolyl isomerase [Candidatus Woesearchaeota archaeon]